MSTFVDEKNELENLLRFEHYEKECQMGGRHLGYKAEYITSGRAMDVYTRMSNEVGYRRRFGDIKPETDETSLLFD